VQIPELQLWLTSNAECQSLTSGMVGALGLVDPPALLFEDKSAANAVVCEVCIGSRCMGLGE
jgi:hypothetical protein